MKSNLASKFKEPINVSVFVQSCFEQAKGNAEQAYDLLIGAARKDRELFIAITEPVLPGACWNLIRRHCHQERRQITRVFSQERSGPERIQRLAEANLSHLFNMALPIPGCPKLGDATKEQVVESANFYLKQAEDMCKKGEWLNKIASMMRKEGTVRKQLTEEQVAEIYPS